MYTCPRTCDIVPNLGTKTSYSFLKNKLDSIQQDIAANLINVLKMWDFSFG